MSGMMVLPSGKYLPRLKPDTDLYKYPFKTNKNGLNRLKTADVFDISLSFT